MVITYLSLHVSTHSLLYNPKFKKQKMKFLLLFTKSNHFHNAKKCKLKIQ